MKKNSLKNLKRLESAFGWMSVGVLIFALIMKFIFPDMDNILRPSIYIYIYILIIFTYPASIYKIKKYKKFETIIGKLSNIVGGLLVFFILIWLWFPFIQSTNYLIIGNHRIIQGELVDKSTSTFTFAQWMTYDIKMKNGEVKNFNYLFPTKRAHQGDWIKFKAGYREGMFDDGIIISIDEIKKKNE